MAIQTSRPERQQPASDERFGHLAGRREFLRSAFSALVAAGGGALLFPMTACDRAVRPGQLAPSRVRMAPSGGALRQMTRRAAPGRVDLAPGVSYNTWLYDGEYPGPEIRAREGERLRVVVENALPEATTVHWHGIPLENRMDGVPGITQEPIAPGGKFVYEFTAAPAGSYLYHTHVGLQLDRGLVGSLVIEENEPHITWDRDYTVVFDDFLPGEPKPLESRRGGMMGGRMMRGGMMGGSMPPYEALLINGRLAAVPATFDVRRGERVRLRLMNPSGATTFRIAIGGHRMEVTHADGRPVRPVTVDNIVLSMGERYDVVVTADNPGVWNIVGVAVEGSFPHARALFRYVDANRTVPEAGDMPAGLTRGKELMLTDLAGLERLESVRAPDRTFDLMLSGGMMSSRWTINGQAYPNADPLDIRPGQRVRFRMTNHSMMIHPMHLHGHFFQVENVLKDTVLVPAHMGRVAFDFVADNPGDWFFHCHNLYHMESGMARVVRYV